MRFALILILFLTTAAFCSGAALPDDVALDKSVTLAVKGEALSDIMPMLEKQTGVRLQADKKIADQKATIFVDAKPLREVMEGLSRTFGYFWATKKYSTGTIYEIWQDEKSVQDLFKQRGTALDAALLAAFGDIEFEAKLANMSPTDREKLKTELSANSDINSRARLDIISKMEKQPLLGTCALMWAALQTSYRKMLKPGVSVRYDVRSDEPEWIIPDGARKLMVDVLNTRGGDPMTVKTTAGSGYTIDPGALTLDENSLNVNFSIRLQKNMLQIMATVSAMSTNGSMSMPNMRPVIMSQQVIGDRIAPIALPRDGDMSVLSRKAAITPEDVRKETECYPQEVRGTMQNRSDVLSLLHSKLGLQVISDHYSNWTTWPITEESSALDILKDFAPTDPLKMLVVMAADWGWDGTFVYARTRDILSADALEVPNRLLRRWASVYEKGGLGLDEYADIATLSPDQKMNLSMYGVYMGIGAPPPMMMAPLRLYGTLSSVQRQQALAGSTSVDAFTPEQMKALAQVFFRPGNSFTFGTKPSASVQVGIWTTEAPVSRIDKPGTAPETEQTSEPPVTVAVREGAPKMGQSAIAMPTPVTTRVTGNFTPPGGFPPGSVTRGWSSADGIPYSAVFTFADGRTQEYGFSIPKPATTPGTDGK